jgi:SSS family solute:Na+ symporter
MIGGSAIMLLIGLDKVGGWHGLMEKAPQMMSIAKPFNDPVYPFWGILATAFYAGIFYWGMDQVNVQRVLAAPNLNNARWGAMFATLLKLLPVFIFALPRVIAFALFPVNCREMKQNRHLYCFLTSSLPSGLRDCLWLRSWPP